MIYFSYSKSLKDTINMPSKQPNRKQKRAAKQAEKMTASTDAIPTSSTSTTPTSTVHASAIAQMSSAPAKISSSASPVASTNKVASSSSHDSSSPASNINEKKYLHITQDGLGILYKTSPEHILGLYTEGLQSCLAIFAFGEKGMLLIHATRKLKQEDMEKNFSKLGEISYCVVAYNQRYQEAFEHITEREPFLKQYKDSKRITMTPTLGAVRADRYILNQVFPGELLPTRLLPPLYMEIRKQINALNNAFLFYNEKTSPDVQFDGVAPCDIPVLIKTPRQITSELPKHEEEALVIPYVKESEQLAKQMVGEWAKLHKLYWDELNSQSKDGFKAKCRKFLALNERHLDQILGDRGSGCMKHIQDDLKRWLKEREQSAVHKQLLKDVTPILHKADVVISKEDAQVILNSIEKKNYAQALRRICAAKTDSQPNSMPMQLMRALLARRDVLGFDINEKAGEKEKAAIHYAASSGNKALYDVLVKHGANPDLKDAKGYSAKEYMDYRDKCSSATLPSAPAGTTVTTPATAATPPIAVIPSTFRP
jgi:hypothetical protein